MTAPTSTRFSGTLPLARLFSSNSSKLPPLDGLSQEDLSKVCGTYKVEVGIQKGTGSFVSFAAAKSKRLMRKKESTVAAAWASNLSEASITTLERTICNGSNRNQTGTPSLSNASSITPLFPNASRAGTSVITGSSNIDGIGHSETCVSKFGIQDIIGNMWETNSEEIFCDYRPENSAELFIGDYSGGVAAAGIDMTKSVPYQSSYYDSSNTAGTLVGKAVRVMVKDNVDQRSGSCSIVDNTVSDGVYLNGNTILPIKTSDGNYNASIILTSKTQDQDSVDALRNGDGSFLSFGKDKVSMALDKNGKITTFSLFNPAVGLPVLCGSAASCDVNSDNQFTKTNLALGNSGFSNNGVAEMSTDILPGGTPAIDLRIPYINQWLISQIISNPGTLPPQSDLLFPVTNMSSNPSGLYPDPTELSSAGWSITRGATLRMYTGGSSKSVSGRYSLYINGLTESQERFPSSQLGGRCVIMINNE